MKQIVLPLNNLSYVFHSNPPDDDRKRGSHDCHPAKRTDKLTVATLPKSNGLKDEAQNHIVPLTVTGTPQELDAGFLQTVTRPIQKAGGLIANMAQFEAQADKAAANSKAAREAKSKESKEERENGKNTRN